MLLNEFELDTGRNCFACLSANLNGSGNPVLAIHGWLDNAASFIPLAQNLDVNRPFYAIDLPGHGLSEHRPEGVSYHLVENVVDISVLIEFILKRHSSDGCQKVTLIGHSLGGIICSLVAASVPDLIDKVILLDSLGPMTDELSNVLPQLRKAVSKAKAIGKSKQTVYPTFDKAVKVRMLGIGRVNKQAASILCERGLEKVEGGYIWRTDPRLLAPSFLRFSEDQIRVIFGGIACDVVLIVGNNGYFAKYEAIEKRIAYFLSVKKLSVDGGHHFHMDGDVVSAAKFIFAELY